MTPRGASMRFSTVRILPLVGALIALGACQPAQDPPPAPPRPVAIAVVAPSVHSDAVTLTGEIQAETEVAAGFRIAGRVIERPVNVGDRVEAGQLLARLDPQTERNALDAAKAALAAARGDIETTRNTFDRQDRLMAQGFTTRPRFDQARAAMETAESTYADAEARVRLAEDRLAFTELRAAAPGVVTARAVEPGEVVQAGQIVVRIARDDARDAVFDVPASLLERGGADIRVRVASAVDPEIFAYGRIREVSPQADPVTRTFRVRVGLQSPPEALLLGSTVNGTVEFGSKTVVSIPARALTMSGRDPAVWLIDPASKRASLRVIDVLRYLPDAVLVSQGLEAGDIVVVGGGQALHPGQIVAPSPAIGAAAAASSRHASLSPSAFPRPDFKSE